MAGLLARIFTPPKPLAHTELASELGKVVRGLLSFRSQVERGEIVGVRSENSSSIRLDDVEIEISARRRKITFLSIRFRSKG